MKILVKTLLVGIFCILANILYAQNIENIIVNGNERVSKETILVFSEINIGDNINNIDSNDILKKIYNSNFFKNVKISINKNEIIINVEENPIIQNVEIQGVKAKKM